MPGRASASLPEHHTRQALQGHVPNTDQRLAAGRAVTTACRLYIWSKVIRSQCGASNADPSEVVSRLERLPMSCDMQYC